MNLRDRVQCLTATTGTGTVTLGAATAGYRTFTSAFAATANVSYLIQDGDAWETGVGSYDKGANTLSRTMDASSTGALLSLSGVAVVSLVFLSREHMPDWPVLIASRYTFDTNGFQRIQSSNGFTIVAINSVSVDTHNGFNTGTYIYTVPQTGLYDIQGKLRLLDSTPSQTSYGIGLDTTNQDSASFFWTQFPPAATGGYTRQTLYNSRQAMLTAGNQLRLFMYVDTSTSTGVSGAEIVVTRVR